MDDPTLIILMYFIIPIWFLAGIVDWYCHKRSNISGTSGAKESLIHLLMFAEVGIPLFMVLIFEVNSLIIAISILLFFVHEATAMWDVSYAVTKRHVGPIEQHVHSFFRNDPAACLSTGGGATLGTFHSTFWCWQYVSRLRVRTERGPFTHMVFSYRIIDSTRFGVCSLSGGINAWFKR